MNDEEKKTRLRAAGWRFSAHGHCKVAGCTAMVEYWIQPGGKGAVLDYIGSRPHWFSCAARKRKRPAPIQLPFRF
jgi:hypothetical protein